MQQQNCRKIRFLNCRHQDHHLCPSPLLPLQQPQSPPAAPPPPAATKAPPLPVYSIPPIFPISFPNHPSNLRHPTQASSGPPSTPCHCPYPLPCTGGRLYSRPHHKVPNHTTSRGHSPCYPQLHCSRKPLRWAPRRPTRLFYVGWGWPSLLHPARNPPWPRHPRPLLRIGAVV